MRRPLLVVAAVVAGMLVVPAAIAVSGSAAQPIDDTVHYSDPAQAGRATVSVRGTLLPIDGETPGADEDSYAVELAGGQLVPVSLNLSTPIEKPREFAGALAVDGTLGRRLTGRGFAVGGGQRLTSDTTEGRRVLSVAASSTSAVPVQSATLAETSEGAAATPAAHKLYVAVITNRGTLDSASRIAAQVQAMRTYWKTESDGLISSFDQVGSSVYYGSTAAAATTAGCGLAKPTAVWNEAAAKFPDVTFGLNGAHLMVLVSEDCAAKSSGIGSVGSSLADGGWSIVSLGDGGVQTGVHELGHNLSLQHANAQLCVSTCSTKDYYGAYSIMGYAISPGSWTPPALDTAYRVQDGIATDAEVPTITDSRSVHLSPRSASTGTRGFLVTDPATKARFAVEYRSGTGRDASAFYAKGGTLEGAPFRYGPGVVVTRLELNGSTTLMSRETSSGYLTSYASGGSFAAGQLRLTVTAAAPSSGANVTVGFGGSSAAPTTPPVSTAKPPARFSAGTPRVVGRAQIGVRLTASTGTWSPRPSRLTYQWYANGRGIYGATRSTFTPTSTQRGDRISVHVTASRTGYATAERVSASTSAVVSGRFRTHRLTISGTRKVGHTLRVHANGWSPSPYFTYRWYASGHLIHNAESSRLTLRHSVRGKRITVRVRAWRGGYVTAARTGPRTARVR